MSPRAAPVPLTVLYRQPGEAALSRVDGLLAERPPGARWALIVEEGDTRLEAPAGTTLHQLLPGCVCCAGQLALRVTVARVLRRERPDALVLELAPGTHREAVERLLTGGTFSGLLAAGSRRS